MPCPPPGSLTKKDRVLAHKAKNPNMSCAELAGMFGVGLRTVKTWLAPTGLGQMRTEDARGQRNVLRADGEASPWGEADEQQGAH